jgi:hypothetical protein
MKTSKKAIETTIVETRNTKTYFGPKPIQPCANVETIVSELAPGMMFERRDHSKILVTAVDETIFRYNELDYNGNKIGDSRRMGKLIFARLMVAKIFESAKISRRETYPDFSKDRRLYACFR